MYSIPLAMRDLQYQTRRKNQYCGDWEELGL